MRTFAQLQAENRRCAFLRFLADAPGRSMNTSLMQTALEAIGHSVSRDQVETDAAWLEEQGLVSREDVNGIMVIHLSQRGADVAAGRAVAPGVKRPGPG